MKKWWKKVRKFFARPGVLKWTIVLVTLVIVGGAIKALVWTIYTKDGPAFVPESVREDIQGAIKESGEAIKNVSEPIGSAIVDAGYVRDCGRNSLADDGQKDVTANWETYTDPTTGVSMKYPEGWKVFEGEEGVFSFGPSEDSYDGVFVYKYKVDSMDLNEWWSGYVSRSDGSFTPISKKTINDKEFSLSQQIDGMQSRYYLLKINNYIYSVSANGEGYSYVEKVLFTIN